MKTMSKTLLTVSVAGFILGLADVGPPMFSGLARALGAVFFILTFITRMFEVIDEVDQRSAPVAQPAAVEVPSHALAAH